MAELNPGADGVYNVVGTRVALRILVAIEPFSPLEGKTISDKLGSRKLKYEELLPYQKFKECGVDRVAIFETFYKATTDAMWHTPGREMMNMVVLDMRMCELSTLCCLRRRGQDLSHRVAPPDKSVGSSDTRFFLRDWKAVRFQFRRAGLMHTNNL